jgi:multisubunit Na+/H+ antiporter MnhE subunit
MLKKVLVRILAVILLAISWLTYDSSGKGELMFFGSIFGLLAIWLYVTVGEKSSKSE